jgi:hypothetical protein
VLNLAGADNDNVTIQGNTVNRVYQGIYVLGANSPAMVDGLTISNNTIGPATSGADNTGLNGIFVQNAAGVTISGNVVRNLSATATGASGIHLNSLVTGGSVAGNTITNVTSNAAAGGTNSIAGIFLGSNATGLTVSGNRIQTVVNNNPTVTGNSGARGITVNPGANPSNITIANNTVTDIYCNQNTSNQSWPFGISLDAGTTIKVYSNSINLFGSHAGLATPSTGAAAALFIASSAVTALDIRNNILSNSYDNSLGGANDQSFAIYSLGAATAFTSIDFNDYYVSGIGTPLVGHLGRPARRTTRRLLPSGRRRRARTSARSRPTRSSWPTMTSTCSPRRRCSSRGRPSPASQPTPTARRAAPSSRPSGLTRSRAPKCRRR